MTENCQLSNNTKTYMENFRGIFKTMTEEMTAVKLSDSISGSFIRQMIPHHRAAIAMSENLLMYTTNIPLQNIALNIISSQTLSIKNMTGIYPGCQNCINTACQLAFYETKNNCILDRMFTEMNSACTDNCIDADFMREMIPHHRGAVCMSENALRCHVCPELVPLLEEIIVSQKRGIRQMHQLLHEISC